MAVPIQQVEVVPSQLSNIIKPEQEWELRSGPEWFWNEGPFVVKHSGKYYVMYSANCFASREYSVGYAVAGGPTGPFFKAAHNLVLFAIVPEISGPGHNSVTTSPDGSDLFIVYHIHTDPNKPSGDRQVCMHRMGFRADGSLYVNRPTNTPQHLPRQRLDRETLTLSFLLSRLRSRRRPVLA